MAGHVHVHDVPVDIYNKYMYMEGCLGGPGTWILTFGTKYNIADAQCREVKDLLWLDMYIMYL